MSKERMKAKIAGLLAKTRSAGCTEAEAMAAAEVAARLMTEHGFSEVDLVMSDAASPESTTRATWRAPLTNTIAFVTNTDWVWLSDEVLFIGRAPGPEIAVYLRDLCFRAVKAELKAFKGGTFYRRRRSLKGRRDASADFVDALVSRLNHRLITLFRPAANPAARTEAAAALSVRYPNLVVRDLPERETRYSAAAAEGWIAGDRVALNRGVTTKPPRQLALLRGD